MTIFKNLMDLLYQSTTSKPISAHTSVFLQKKHDTIPGGFFGETQGIVVKIHNFTPMTGQFQRPFPSPRSTAVKSSSPRQWRPLGTPRPLAGTAGQRRRWRGWDVSVWITVPGVQDVDFNLEFTGMQQSWLLNSLQNPNIYV